MNLSREQVARMLARRTTPAPVKPRKKTGTGDWAQHKQWLAAMCRELGIFIPMRTVCELNDHTFWINRQKRAEQQRTVIAATFKGYEYLRERPSLVVVLTRYAPGTLDPQDNLPSAFKHVRDALAKRIGVDDKSNWYDWQYQQVKTGRGRYGIRIHPPPHPRRAPPGGLTETQMPPKTLTEAIEEIEQQRQHARMLVAKCRQAGDFGERARAALATYNRVLRVLKQVNH